MSKIFPIAFNTPNQYFLDTHSGMRQEQASVGNILSTHFDWLTDPVLKEALYELQITNFDANDIAYVNSLGLELPFTSGEQVVDFIANNNVRILFDSIKDSDVHAHYNYEKNIIYINDKYIGTKDKAIVLAISESILHETGHAKDKDGKTSVQEELECLAMNAIAHRSIVKRHSDIFSPSVALIVKEGVSLYEDLFFNRHDDNNALIARVRDKYGYLPVGCDKHPPSELARRVKVNISL